MKNKFTNLFLIGPFGSGKTTVGKVLAAATGRIFIDSDHEIEKQTGVDIPWIFEKEGEAGFRKRESEVINQLTQQHHIILSTGGGAILAPENREQLKNRGVVIYLTVSIEQQMKRVIHNKHARPLLKTYDSHEKLLELSRLREPFYLEIADFIYDTDNNRPQEIADAILNDIAQLTRDH